MFFCVTGAGTEKVPQPYFEPVGSGNTTVYTGQDAFLHCRVRGVGDREVSRFPLKSFYVLYFYLINKTHPDACKATIIVRMHGN